jgi:hypothetical protein
VHYAEDHSRRDWAADSPAAKRLGHVFKKNESVPTGTLGCACAGIPCASPTSGNTYGRPYCPRVIDQKETRKQIDGSYWHQLAVAGDSLQLLGSPHRRGVDLALYLAQQHPDWRRYILPMILAGVGRS